MLLYQLVQFQVRSHTGVLSSYIHVPHFFNATSGAEKVHEGKVVRKEGRKLPIKAGGTSRYSVRDASMLVTPDRVTVTI